MTSDAMEISTMSTPTPNPAASSALLNELTKNPVKTLETALAALVQNQIKNDSCIYCGKKVSINGTSTPESVVFCSGCKLAKYCSEEHQVSNE